MVARSDKGSVTFHRFHLRSMRLAHIYDRLLQQMLQEALMPRAHLVELINIDQSETGKIQLGIPLLAEIDAVRVIRIQVRWQQVEAERGLPAPLPAKSGERLLPCCLSRPCQCATIDRNQV